MNSKKKPKVIILDTSAILSGKPIHLDDTKMVTTPSISKELKPGGRDFQSFNFLLERGLLIHTPSKESINKVKNISEILSCVIIKGAKMAVCGKMEIKPL